MIGVFKYPDYLRRKDSNGCQWYRYAACPTFMGYGYTQWRKLDWKGDFVCCPVTKMFEQKWFNCQDLENQFFEGL